MNSFPDELIYVLIFAALLLFQYVVQRIRRRRQQSEAPQEEPLPQDESLPEIWGRAPAIPAVSPVPVERVGRSVGIGFCVTPSRVAVAPPRAGCSRV
jgi:hypothetical protein